MSIKKGRMTDEEKRQIEKLIPYHTYEEVAVKLNRSPNTVRRYCQRSGITRDKVSAEKNLETKIKDSAQFAPLVKQLEPEEIQAVIHIYENMMRQFGSDVTFSEEQQILDYARTSCLLDRALAREHVLSREIDKMNKEVKQLERELEKMKKEGQRDEQFDEKEDMLLEKIDQANVERATAMDELKSVRANQNTFINQKQSLLGNMNSTRKARANELTKANESLADQLAYMQKNPAYRRELGIKMEKNRLGMKEEYIRLSELHKYADGLEDRPVINAEIIEELKKKGEL
jgi:hypothetical protein